MLSPESEAGRLGIETKEELGCTSLKFSKVDISWAGMVTHSCDPSTGEAEATEKDVAHPTPHQK